MGSLGRHGLLGIDLQPGQKLLCFPGVFVGQVVFLIRVGGDIEQLDLRRGIIAMGGAGALAVDDQLPLPATKGGANGPVIVQDLATG